MISRSMRNVLFRGAFIFGIGLLLASCAGTPGPVVTVSGAMPAPGNYALADSGVDARPDWQGVVVKGLQNHGLVQGPRSSYLVQLALTERPAFVGTLQPDEKIRDRQRRPSARLAGKQIATLTVLITDTATGRELYRASALTVGRSDVDEVMVGRMADAILPSDDGNRPMGTHSRT
ncbi:hypothetical protein [Sphingomonas sp. dw_22]|uniref:hypothetical protein n=1 Tax=Sphingomonas sp. dw_22 TaxID=2721175 RepID=UPI001BD229E9|nr:hypothetical protein [Sphingomonas sp. dw_22]